VASTPSGGVAEW